MGLSGPFCQRGRLGPGGVRVGERSLRGADRGRHGVPPGSIGVPRDLLRAVWGKGRWWRRAGGLGVFPVSRFPSPPGAFGRKHLEWFAQPRPAARKEKLGRCTSWPADPGRGGQLALCRFAHFLAGTCRPPPSIMSDASSAGPGPPKRCPRKPRTCSHPIAWLFVPIQGADGGIWRLRTGGFRGLESALLRTHKSERHRL